MKLIAHEEGRSLQLISADEIRPLRGGVFSPDAVAKIAGKYQFQKFPATFEPNTIIKFETGVAESAGVTIPITNLDIYGDGFLISTTNTDDSDFVLTEFMNWGIREFGFRSPTTLVPRRYTSRIIVDLDGVFDDLASDFSVMSKVASKLFDGKPDNLSMLTLQIGPFPPTQYPYLTTWNLARRITEPMVPNRYSSHAPLSSGAHLAFLETVERQLRAK